MSCGVAHKDTAKIERANKAIIVEKRECFIFKITDKRLFDTMYKDFMRNGYCYARSYITLESNVQQG